MDLTLYASAANGTEGVIHREALAAETAELRSALRFLGPQEVGVGVGDGPFTTIADQDRLAGLDLEHGDEKNAQVMVHPFEIGLMQAAPGAAAGRFLQDFNLGLDAADEKKEAIKHVGAPAPLPNTCSPSWFVFGGFQQKSNHIIGVQSTWTSRLKSPSSSIKAKEGRFFHPAS
jgi:hypothetical protein